MTCDTGVGGVEIQALGSKEPEFDVTSLWSWALVRSGADNGARWPTGSAGLGERAQVGSFRGCGWVLRGMADGGLDWEPCDSSSIQAPRGCAM